MPSESACCDGNGARRGRAQTSMLAQGLRIEACLPLCLVACNTAGNHAAHRVVRTDEKRKAIQPTDEAQLSFWAFGLSVGLRIEVLFHVRTNRLRVLAVVKHSYSYRCVASLPIQIYLSKPLGAVIIRSRTIEPQSQDTFHRLRVTRHTLALAFSLITHTAASVVDRRSSSATASLGHAPSIRCCSHSCRNQRPWQQHQTLPGEYAIAGSIHRLLNIAECRAATRIDILMSITAKQPGLDAFGQLAT